MHLPVHLVHNRHGMAWHGMGKRIFTGFSKQLFYLL